MDSIFNTIKSMESIRGIPQFLFCASIDIKTLMKVREGVVKFKKINPSITQIDFIINSGGGWPDDAYKIIRTLRTHFNSVNVIVPYWAKSAATLLSLGATSIIMDEFGEFGPLDAQIGVERDDSPKLEQESALNDEYSVRRIEARAAILYAEMFTNLHGSDKIRINKVELSSQILNYLYFTLKGFVQMFESEV